MTAAPRVSRAWRRRRRGSARPWTRADLHVAPATWRKLRRAGVAARDDVHASRSGARGSAWIAELKIGRMLAMLVLAVAAWPHAAWVRADTTECLAAYEKAQAHEQRGELLAGRRELERCALESCPALVRNDCVHWLAQVGAAIPVVTFDVSTDRGESLDAFRVYRGDRLLQLAGDWRRAELDPGTHRLRVEADGYLPVETVVELREAERRIVDVRLTRAGPVRPPAAVLAVRSEPSAQTQGGLQLPAALYLGLGGAALSGWAVFTGFALSGDGRLDELERCKPRCEPGYAERSLDAADRDYLIANIGLIAGSVFTAALGVLVISDASGAFQDGASVSRRRGVPLIGARF